MSIQDNHNARLKYLGGKAEGRMEKSKLNSLKKALFNSYQAETAVLQDGRKFKCLINPSRLKADYDVKVISIPFEDICLNEKELLMEQAGDIEPDMMVFTPRKTSQGIQKIGMKVGDTFEWEETGTHWLVDLHHIEEESYFRAEIHRCDQQINVNGIDYWVYIRGPVETTQEWGKSSSFFLEGLNYSLVMYITKDENTSEFFHRNNKIKVKGDNWEIQGVNDYYLDGVIEVFLKESHNNQIEDIQKEEESPILSLIQGKKTIYPYEKVSYTIERNDGEWILETEKKNQIYVNQSDLIEFEILSTRSGNALLKYIVDGNIVDSINIIIDSL